MKEDILELDCSELSAIVGGTDLGIILPEVPAAVAGQLISDPAGVYINGFQILPPPPPPPINGV